MHKEVPSIRHHVIGWDCRPKELDALPKKEAREWLRREQIVAAAFQVFSEKGVHQTKVEEIALIAGIGKGTIYEYFGSKLEIFFSMMLWIFERYYSKLEENIPNDESAWRQIEKITDSLFEMHDDFKKLHVMLMSEFKHIPDDMTPILFQQRAKKLELIQTVIKKGQSAKEFDGTVDSSLAAEMVLCSFEGIIGYRSLMNTELEIDNTKLQILAMIRKMLH
ncbi:hypothetical protein BHU72_00060 [Desulfuribacillus stibiiarsenatis]|uniref:HTH tetR-type domain-containing protein n=2 Tax=Desulfuribacillus stibiiarsenatis TaxID=1390249 RepID=A0A1E5L972_9FIRM|nr:hypothetical protein BHU72_00060 [Desulfuribacillus stibiiarsenatis]